MGKKCVIIQELCSVKEKRLHIGYTLQCMAAKTVPKMLT